MGFLFFKSCLCPSHLAVSYTNLFPFGVFILHFITLNMPCIKVAENRNYITRLLDFESHVLSP